MKAFLEYETKIQKLVFLKDKGLLPLCDLLAFIDFHYECSHGISFYQIFFKAEHAFFSDNHAKALSLYMSSQLIPHSSFFCYRAAAFLAHQNHFPERALCYAKKAKTFNDKDYSIHKILKLLIQQPQIVSPSIISLAQEERDALTDLFFQAKQVSKEI